MGASFLACGILGLLGVHNLLKEDDGNAFKFLFWFMVLLCCVMFPLFVMIAVG